MQFCIDFGTDDWFRDQFDDIVFGDIDQITRDDDQVNRNAKSQGEHSEDDLDVTQFDSNYG